jgi:hypothetical protein
MSLMNKQFKKKNPKIIEQFKYKNLNLNQFKSLLNTWNWNVGFCLKVNLNGWILIKYIYIYIYI